MPEIDKVSRAIIALLLKDGRMSSAEIASHVGISERSVRYRLDRLIKAGVIHIGAIVNPKAVGYPVTGDVWLEIEPGQVLTVARKMAELEQVSYVACSTGDMDLSLQIYARNNEELYRFVTEIIGNTPGVRKTSTMIVPLVLKDVYHWSIPRETTDPGKEEGGA
jgi:Lrp/AsnC family transcriptional regulator for asnA, asnC and gidA